MTESNPFLGYSRKYREIEVGGKKIRVKPKVRDAEIFIAMGSEKGITSEWAEKITSIMIDMIKRANPKPDNVSEEEYNEDIEAFVAEHYGELFVKLGVLYGFTTEEKIKEEMEKIKKKLVESRTKSKD